MRRVLSASIIAFAAAAPWLITPAHAKLPPLSEEAKAKAAEAAAKTAWTGKVESYALCRAMDRTAEYYRKTAPATGKTVAAATETPPCADPGPFVPPVAAAAAPPLEAAGAHSPPQPAAKPPSTNATAAELDGKAPK